MAQKTVGYVHLEWTCPNCSTRNPGPQKTCSGCGAPQPEDVQFEQAAEEKLIQDEAALARAKLGPDIHCYFCGTRNAADAKTCSQCGADLTQGKARGAGQVLGTHRSGPAEKITCPACGTPNEAGAPRCVQCGAGLAQPKPTAPPPAAKAAGANTRLLTIIAVAVLLLCCAGAITFMVLGGRTQDTSGRVDAVAWTRTIAIEGLAPVEHEDWRDEVPVGSVVGTCSQKIHHTQDDPAPNAREICGTPFTVDKGSGFGEVVQECQYEVYADWCKYTVEEWSKVDEARSTGRDLRPQWPVVRLRSGQREGQREESYEVIFKSDGETYSYQPSDPAEFARFEPGSRWVLKVNTFGSVVSAEPAG